MTTTSELIRRHIAATDNLDAAANWEHQSWDRARITRQQWETDRVHAEAAATELEARAANGDAEAAHYLWI